jgi:hypothetical protein
MVTWLGGPHPSLPVAAAPHLFRLLLPRLAPAPPTRGLPHSTSGTYSTPRKSFREILEEEKAQARRQQPPLTHASSPLVGSGGSRTFGSGGSGPRDSRRRG